MGMVDGWWWVVYYTIGGWYTIYHWNRGRGWTTWIQIPSFFLSPLCRSNRLVSSISQLAVEQLEAIIQVVSCFATARSLKFSIVWWYYPFHPLLVQNLATHAFKDCLIATAWSYTWETSMRPPLLWETTRETIVRTSDIMTSDSGVAVWLVWQNNMWHWWQDISQSSDIWGPARFVGDLLCNSRGFVVQLDPIGRNFKFVQNNN